MIRLIQIILILTFANSNVCHGELDSFFYEKDGHRDTTSFIARLAGFEPLKALELSYYSQAPDESLKYHAVSVAIWGVVYPSYRENIMENLHSLHGGDKSQIEARRTKLLKLISEFDPDKSELWQLGFMIHAAGDSYAHTYGEDEAEKAYGPIYGHALAFGCKKGKTPDAILANPVKYNTYIDELWTALKKTKLSVNESNIKYLNQYKTWITTQSDTNFNCDSISFSSGLPPELKKIDGVVKNSDFKDIEFSKEVRENAEKMEAEWKRNFNFSKVELFLNELAIKLK